MKKIFTLAAAASLAAASFNAQAQIVLDGKVNTSEIASTNTLGKYQLVSSYTGTHSVANTGLQSLYVGATATKLYVAVVGSFEQTGYTALVGYLNVPGVTGVPAGTKLVGSSEATSPLKHKPTMDFEVDYGIRLTVAPLANTNAYFSYVDYTKGNAAAVAEPYQGNPDKSGTVTTATATTGPFVGWKVAYMNAASVTANTDNKAVEFEFDLAALGVTASNAKIDMFFAYTDGDGVFTSDTFPPIAGQATALAADQDFTAIAGKQYLTYQLGTGVLASKKEASALALDVYPNPVQGASTVTYQVTERASNVNIVLTDLLGRTVRTLENSIKQVGTQTAAVNAAALAAGTYLVRVQVGDKVSTSKVSVL